MNVLVMAEGAPCGALGGVVQWCASLGASISVAPDDPFGEVTFLEQLFVFQIMPGDVYYVTRIPSELVLQDVTVIAVSAFVLTSLATLYPARRAALVNPAAALRYE